VKLNDLPGIISCKNAALKTPLAFDPGDHWEYGINIDFAGKAVEAVSGKGLNVYLRENKTPTSHRTGSEDRTGERACAQGGRRP